MALLLLSLLLSATSMIAADERDSGPLNLLIAWRCAPANRPAFREYLTRTGRAQFEQWKREGVLEEYCLLFNWYVDADAWDALVIIRFRRYADVARWKAIERARPGGLSEEALKLATPLHTYSADAAWQGASETGKGNSPESVFFVIPYELLLKIFSPGVFERVQPDIVFQTVKEHLLAHHLTQHMQHPGPFEEGRIGKHCIFVSCILDDQRPVEIFSLHLPHRLQVILPAACPFAPQRRGISSELFGFPPKVIWIRIGNCRTSAIEQLLRDHFDDINDLAEDEGIGMLTLF